MTTAFTATSTIAAPVDEVWNRLTDWEQAPDWMEVIDSMTAEGPDEAGTVITFVGRGKERTSTITELTPRKSVTLRSVQGGVTADYVYCVEPQGDDTLVTLVAGCEGRGLWKIAGPLIRLAMRSADGGQLDALKAVVEAR